MVEDITQSVAYYCLINYLAGNLLSDLEVQCLVSYARRRFNNTGSVTVYRWESELSEKQAKLIVSASTEKIAARKAGRTYFTQQVLDGTIPKNKRKQCYNYKILALQTIPLLTTPQIETLITEFYATDRYQPKRYIKMESGEVVYAVPFIGRNKKQCLETLQKEKEVIILRDEIETTQLIQEGRRRLSPKSVY